MKPIRQKTRPVPFNLREKFKKTLDEQLEANLIEPSNSPWSSPINIVGKKDGGIRIIEDYRQLNEVTSKYYTKIDCFSGFYQNKLDETSKPLTAFSCEYGIFQFKVMPIGLTNAPATFQKVMNWVFKALIEQNKVIVFIDDFLIHSPDLKTHLENIVAVTERLKSSKIKVKLNKPDEEKLAAIKNFNLPTDLEKLMGLTNQYRKFIKSFAKIARPIYQMMLTNHLESSFKNKNGTIKSKKVYIEWNTEAIAAFEKLKEAI
ncbi:unnamed protein product [Brachionus calyciflorus]|uniref:Reverse transcriptase domain-containing protein n=1 Tax=Brachionus calyciflorus TaxID=104777 RepID=A0A813V726_9BILA|nr:unnamed protein product [Brachionus calyciflorus]